MTLSWGAETAVRAPFIIDALVELRENSEYISQPEKK
jgi:hypothetical protein